MSDICELNLDELEMVSGGGIAGYKECPAGAAGGGGAGLYPNYVECASTVQDGINAFIGAFKANGGVMPPAPGGGSGSGSGSGGYPA